MTQLKQEEFVYCDRFLCKFERMAGLILRAKGKIKYRVIQQDCRGTSFQRQFRTKFGKQPTSENSIRRWYAQFQETVCVCILELKVRIRTATETITADMRNELDYRVDVCRITKDAHIEHL